MKIISWNINGINRRNEDRNLDKFIKKENPDILCIQEIRTKNENVLKILEEYDYIVYSFAGNPSRYHGTAICTKVEPLSVKKGIGDEEFDEQGRVIRMEFENFYLFNVYAPSGTETTERTQEESFVRKCDFYDEFTEYVYKSNKPSIICGDFNRVSKEIDAIDIKKLKKTGFAPEEQEWFKEILTKYVDAFREFNQEGDNFTWYWDVEHRKENRGFRFDYFLVSNTLKNKLSDSYIIHEDFGSDHAPIVLKLKDLNKKEQKILKSDCMYEKIDFDYEIMLQSLTNARLKILFDLEYIAYEFQFNGLTVDCLASGKKTKPLKVDGLAFDKKTNSFVILEYKNRLNINVLNQGEDYYYNLLQKDADKLIDRYKYKLQEEEKKRENTEKEEGFDLKKSYEILDYGKKYYCELLQKNREKLIERYNEKFGENRVEGDFDFSKVKVMIIGPKFLEEQIKESENLEYPHELYKVSLYRCDEIKGCVSYKGITVDFENKINVNLGNLKYTRYTLLYNKTKEIRELYNNFEYILLNKYNDIDVKYFVDLVAIRVQNKKICLITVNNPIKIDFNTDKIETKFTINSLSDIDDACKLFKQVYEEKKEE